MPFSGKHTVDILGVGVFEAGRAVAVTSVPDIETVLLLAVVAGLDILFEVGAADMSDPVAGITE